MIILQNASYLDLIGFFDNLVWLNKLKVETSNYLHWLFSLVTFLIGIKNNLEQMSK